MLARGERRLSVAAVQRRCLQAQLLRLGITWDYDLVEQLRLEADRALTVSRVKAAGGENVRAKPQVLAGPARRTKARSICLVTRDSAGLVHVQQPQTEQFKAGELAKRANRVLDGIDNAHLDKLGAEATQLVTELRAQQVSVLAAVPPLWQQLLNVASFRDEPLQSLRLVTNAGGHLPVPVVRALRRAQPQARLFLMYGLTEVLRSTFLPPAEVDRRPDSIGRAIPGAEVLVLRDDLTPCAGSAGRARTRISARSRRRSRRASR